MTIELGRLHPNVVIKRSVVNQSARAVGAHINLIVIHDTESHNRPANADLAAIGDWFNNPQAQASAHVCTDGAGNSAIYVDSVRKAWHVEHYNSNALGIEQIGFSVDPQPAWDDRPGELHETARWVARWSIMYQIPILHGAVSDGFVTRSGVVMHSELGVLGGNHNDPGAGYPFGAVLALAEDYKHALGH